MKVKLNRKSLEALVKGTKPHYSEFEHPLIKKAGHSYNDQYGITNWDNLSMLTDKELYTLHLICINSWN